MFFAAVLVVVLGWQYRRRLRPTSDTVEISTPASIRRGEDVGIAITIRGGAHTGVRLRVGILCVERYDVEKSTKDGSYRVTEEEFAHEEWREISASEAQQGLTFAVPAAAPYSYRGSCLSFEWRAEALEIARFRPDAVARCIFEVRP
ncbi:MAG: hypothetical protein ACRDM2_00620 [Gaiellaceae bacterium]